MPAIKIEPISPKRTPPQSYPSILPVPTLTKKRNRPVTPIRPSRVRRALFQENPSQITQLAQSPYYDIIKALRIIESPQNTKKSHPKPLRRTYNFAPLPQLPQTPDVLLLDPITQFDSDSDSDHHYDSDSLDLDISRLPPRKYQ